MIHFHEKIKERIPKLTQDTLDLIKNAPERFGGILMQELLRYPNDISKVNWDNVLINNNDFGFIGKNLYIDFVISYSDYKANTNLDFFKYKIDTENRYWNGANEKQAYEAYLKGLHLFKTNNFVIQKIRPFKDDNTNKTLLNYTGWRLMLITLIQKFYIGFELISNLTDKKIIFKKILSNSKRIYLVFDNNELKGEMNYGKPIIPQFHYIVLPDHLSDSYFKSISYEDFFLKENNEFLFTMHINNPMIHLNSLDLATFSTILVMNFENSPNLTIPNQVKHPYLVNNTIEMLFKKHIYFYMDLLSYLAPPLENFIAQIIE